LQHLIEDTEDLWRKHVCKDFKVAKLTSGGSWREMYQVRLVAQSEGRGGAITLYLKIRKNWLRRRRS
jgi:hypothetical protein